MVGVCTQGCSSLLNLDVKLTEKIVFGMYDLPMLY